MKIISELSVKPVIQNPVVTLGTFDGVHLGHKKILERLIARAKQINGHSVVLTFDPHPRKVLFPFDENIKLINTLDEKIENLKNAGVDYVILIKFDKAFSRLSALDFVRDYLVNKIGIKELIIGYDHHFGRNREGSIEVLNELATTFGFNLEEIPARIIDEVSVSSTKIRNAILTGDIASANDFLGYKFYFSGLVVEGTKKGRTLGFPTANINFNNADKIFPANGVYLVRVNIENTKYYGLMNIGNKPTMGNFANSSVEIFIIDFNKDIYHKQVQVEMILRMRNEIKFNSVEELKIQIGKDLDSANLWISKYSNQ